MPLSICGMIRSLPMQRLFLGSYAGAVFDPVFMEAEENGVDKRAEIFLGKMDRILLSEKRRKDK